MYYLVLIFLFAALVVLQYLVFFFFFFQPNCFPLSLCSVEYNSVLCLCSECKFSDLSLVFLVE